MQRLDDDEAISRIGEAIHTGLRKGTEAREARELWVAITMSDEAWDDALQWAVETLAEQGIVLCREETP